MHKLESDRTRGAPFRTLRNAFRLQSMILSKSQDHSAIERVASSTSRRHPACGVIISWQLRRIADGTFAGVRLLLLQGWCEFPDEGRPPMELGPSFIRVNAILRRQ